MAQRFVVIRCLRAQCESGQLLVDLFVNYDCDLEGQNLFERMVLALVRLAQGNTPPDVTAQVIAEEQAMRLAVSLPASPQPDMPNTLMYTCTHMQACCTTVPNGKPFQRPSCHMQSWCWSSVIPPCLVQA